MKLEVGQFVRTKNGIIDKVILNYNGKCASPNCNCKHISCEKDYYDEEAITKASHNIIELIEYMDLLEIENPIKLYNKDMEISLFNPVRCDGFTIFEDGTHCIILNLDYLVDIKDLKVKSILTKEQMEANQYVIK